MYVINQFGLWNFIDRTENLMLQEILPDIISNTFTIVKIDRQQATKSKKQSVTIQLWFLFWSVLLKPKSESLLSNWPILYINCSFGDLLSVYRSRLSCKLWELILFFNFTQEPTQCFPEGNWCTSSLYYQHLKLTLCQNKCFLI